MMHAACAKRINHFLLSGSGRALHFWPFLVLGGRLAMKIVLNLWNMIES